MSKKMISIIVSIVVVIGGIGLFLFNGKDNYMDVLNEVKECTSYSLSGNMEMIENDELKSFYVNVDYKKTEDQEYYKLELYDKSLNQAQIIIRNEEGVFVITPTLNQIFKFQSDWPNNSPKPYMYHSLLSVFDNGTVEKMDDNYIVNNVVAYPNDTRVASQEIVFNKKLEPVSVIVYDQDKIELITIAFDEFKLNTELSDDVFNQEMIMEDNNVSYQTEVSIPLYPISKLGTTLTSEAVSVVGDTTNHILKFSGDKSFTIIQSIMEPNEELVIDTVSSEVIDFVDGVAFYEEQQLTMIQSGVVCKIYSTELTKDEMVSVMSSMRSQALK